MEIKLNSQKTDGDLRFHRCQSCGGSEFGLVENKVEMVMPKHWKTDRESKTFYVDACMVPELSFLWKNGIRTIECCCGHGSADGYIAVSKSSIKKMCSLGYAMIDSAKDRSNLFTPRWSKSLPPSCFNCGNYKQVSSFGAKECSIGFDGIFECGQQWTPVKRR